MTADTSASSSSCTGVAEEKVALEAEARKEPPQDILRLVAGTHDGFLPGGVDPVPFTQDGKLVRQGTVPEAIIAFLESDSYEDAIRNAISLGGDSDTQACITGGIAEAYYGPVAPVIMREVRERLTEDLWRITEQFCRRYGSDETK